MQKIEHCLSQLSDQQIWWRPAADMNAIGNLLLHLAGNLGQWIVAGIGDLPDTRDRPREFSERQHLEKAALLRRLHEIVEASCATLAKLSADDFLVVRRVQGSDVTKTHAMFNSVTHFQGHVQEIIGLTRQQLGGQYQFQWTPATIEEGAPPRDSLDND